jgi:hypothetical protein
MLRVAGNLPRPRASREMTWRARPSGLTKTREKLGRGAAATKQLKYYRLNPRLHLYLPDVTNYYTTAPPRYALHPPV